MIADRPLKFAEEEVNYRDSTEDALCGKCVHFFTREVDKHHTCEIFRPKDDASIEPNYVCDFFSADGEEFPLLDD
jgi:hypothetical protein